MDYIVTALEVIGVIIYIILWMALVVGSFMAILEGQFTLGIAMILIWLAITVVPVTYYIHNQATHGSCQYEHWAGKSYVCDQYYPLPQVAE